MEPTTPSSMHEGRDVFDDEFAVDDFEFIGDGFAPGRVVDDGYSEAGDGDGVVEREPAIRSVAAHMADMPMPMTTTSPASRFGARNSIRKSREAQNPFRSVEDEDDTQSTLSRTQSIRSQSNVAYAPGITHRSVSSTSSRAFAPSQSPFPVGSGPSHPYAMYPQGTNLARTLSTSTVSTIRAPGRPLLTGQGPTHPYSMYPQNVSEDIVSEAGQEHGGNVNGNVNGSGTTPAHAHIPVGFPGRNQAFHRQTAPTGEEQDIIGVDGHTEQLPPYSEYPEDGVPKHIALPVQTAVLTPSNETQLTMPLVPARPQSMSDAGNRANTASFASMEQMESNDSVQSGPKRWGDKTWKEKRKTKFCGIPFWWILLSLGVLAFIATVLGGAIGGFMGSQKRNSHNKHAIPKTQLPSSSSLFDASPIPTSSSGNPPPTGTYALSLGTAEATQAACLTNQSYGQAWGCNMADTQSLALVIQNPPSGSTGWEGALLFDTSTTERQNNISYGTQPPTTTFSQFIAVQDNDDPEQGPAFYFQSYYDKLVIVPEGAFPSQSGSSNSRRAAWDPSYSLPDAWHTRHQISAGQKPWFCYWNSTFLEGFIYADNSTTNISTSSVSESAASVTTTPPPTSSPSAPSSYIPSSASVAMSASAITSANDMIESQSSSSTATQSKRDSVYDELPAFGYMVKIEERRIPGMPSPYCQQMQILDDGTAGRLRTIINLGEQDPGWSAYQSASSFSSSSSSSSRMARRADTVAGGCHCQWWSGASS